MLIVVIAYPYIEKAFTKDNAIHNLLQRPRDVPVRTSLGVAFMTFYIVNLINGANDLFAFKLDISLNVMTWAGRVLSIIGPIIAYVVTYRICLGLQHSDRAVLEHGIETGVIKRLPNGQFIEVHQPLGPVDDHGHAVPLVYQGAAVPKRMNQLGLGGRGGAGRPAARGRFGPHLLRRRAASTGARVRQPALAGGRTLRGQRARFRDIDRTDDTHAFRSQPVDPDVAVANFARTTCPCCSAPPAARSTGPTDSRADQQHASVAVGDFDADGDPDLAVANSDSSNVSVLLNDSNPAPGA